MVFYQLGLGFATGIAISMYAKEEVYITIATCHYMPHYKYRQAKKKYISQYQAINTDMIETYFKDVVSSYLLFWLAIGPIAYRHYFKQGQETVLDEPEDTFSKTLIKKKFGSDKIDQGERPIEYEADGSVKLPEDRITLDEYEKFVNRL